jgi:hypothetical protein
VSNWSSFPAWKQRPYALWKLGGVPKAHRTDRLSAAVNNSSARKEFRQQYEGLLQHYRLKGEKIQAGKGNENGDREQRHHRLKRAVDQSLMLRGSRDFEDRSAYADFLEELFTQLNKGRKERLSEEQKVLGSLPERRLEDFKKLEVRVGPGSTIHILHNVYSVHSVIYKIIFLQEYRNKTTQKLGNNKVMSGIKFLK